MRRELWLIFAPGVLLAGAHLLPVPRNGNLAGLPPLCPYKILTGCPCPGCGLTRSLVFCAHGDWTQAFSFHPLGLVFYAGLWLALLLGIFSLRWEQRSFSQPVALIAGSTCAAALLIVWLIRLSGVLRFPTNI